MKVGIFDHMDRGGLPLARQYEDRLKLIEAYDRAGFYAYHLAEHHSTPLGMAPSPGVFLSAVAQRTRTLRFGPLVYPLPLYPPLRAFEEICMLDHLSNGRLIVGIGRGASPYEVEYYGVDPKEAQTRYMEAYTVLMQAFSGGTLDFAGQFYSLRGVPIELAPLQKPHPPLWYGAINEEGAAWAAKNAINIVCNGPAAMLRALGDRYRAEWQAAGRRAAGLPLIGMNRYVVLAESEAEAMSVASRAYDRWQKSFYYLWDKRGGVSANVAAIYPRSFEEAQSRGYAIAGTPAKARAALLAQTAEAGNNYLLCRFAFGDLTLAESLRSLDLFAREVMPALDIARVAAE